MASDAPAPRDAGPASVPRVSEVAPPPAAGWVSEGQDFSNLRSLLSQLQNVKPAPKPPAAPPAAKK